MFGKRQGRDGAARNAARKKLTGNVPTNRVDEILIALTGPAQVVFIEITGELAVFLESREGLDHLDGRRFRNLDVFLGRFTLQGPFGHDIAQDHCAGILTFEHIGAELLAQPRA